MSQFKQSKLDKEGAWRLGIEGDEEAFNAWMEDKWGLQHGMKLNTLFSDAKRNTTCLKQFTDATARVGRIDLTPFTKKNVGVPTAVQARLAQLVGALNIDLPDNRDITDSSIMAQRPAKGTTPNKDLAKRQQKTYSRILVAAAALCNYVAQLFETAGSNKKSVEFMQYCTILHAGIMDGIRGFGQGHCHKQLHGQLSQKVKSMTAG